MGELNSFGTLPVATPAILAAGASPARSVRVAVLGGEDEERVGAVIFLAVLDSAKPVGVAVSEKVLRGGVPAVCEVFEQAGGLVDEVIVLLNGLLDLNDVGLGLDGNGEGLHGRVLHEEQRRRGGQWRRCGTGATRGPPTRAAQDRGTTAT